MLRQGCAFHTDLRKSNPETSLPRLLLIQNVAGCLHYPALTSWIVAMSVSETPAAHKPRCQKHSSSPGLMGCKLTMYTALCDAIYHFRSSIIVKWFELMIPEICNSQIILKTRVWMSHDSYTSSVTLASLALSCLQCFLTCTSSPC